MERIAVRSEGRSVACPQVAESSLSQKLVALQAALDSQPERIGSVYDRLYLRHFGQPSRRKSTPRNDAALAKAEAWCKERGVNVADFIAANMILLGPRVRGRFRFQPSLLNGPSAERRYNGVLGRANRRFQRGSMAVFSRETWLGAIRESLFYAELGAGDLFVSMRLAGDRVSWDEVVKMIAPSNKDWADFQRQVGCFARIAAAFDRQRAVAEGDLVRLRAAWSVAEKTQPGLADRIGFIDFSWPAFANLLAYATEGRREKRESVEVHGLGGRTWGNWR